MTTSIPWPTAEEMARCKDRDLRDHISDKIREMTANMVEFFRGAWSDEHIGQILARRIGHGPRRKKAARRALRREARAEKARRDAGDRPSIGWFA